MAKEAKICGKCKAIENSYIDPYEDTRHKQCDRCKISLCVNCDRGEYLFGKEIGLRLGKMLSENIDSGKLKRGDFIRLCKECMNTELNKEFDELETLSDSKWPGFRWAQEHESVRLGTIGTDEYDMTPQKRCSDLIPVLNPSMVIARKRARKWLASQPDAWLIHFSLERTNEMLAHRGNITDYEIDAVIDMAPRRTVMYEAFQNKVREEFCKVSDTEADELWKKIVRICGGCDAER